MSRDREVLRAYERLAAALSSEIIGADDEDAMASHAGRGGRVAAESLRQHIRRIGLARRDDLGAESVRCPGQGIGATRAEEKP